MIATLPEALFAAVEAEISAHSAAQIHQAAERLSQAYRGLAGIRPALAAVDRAAYLAVRFPSTFAATNAVWTESARALRLDEVATVLDIGSGPGTASLALPAETAISFTQLERDIGWRDVAYRLAQAAGINAAFKHGAITSQLEAPRHDVVIASYSLSELPQQELEPTVARLWSLAKSAFIVVEPGTPKGFAIIQAVREHALSNAGHAAAPCTHDARCPMSTDDWCHRPVRVARTALHRAAKGAHLAYEDEKIAYVVMTRAPPARDAPARIVRKPILARGHVHLDLCEASGLQRRTVSRRDGPLYRAARKVSWGDLWPLSQDD